MIVLIFPHTQSKGRAIQNDTIENMTTALALSRDYRDRTVNSVDVQCVCHTGESRSRDLSEGDVILLTESDRGNNVSKNLRRSNIKSAQSLDANCFHTEYEKNIVPKFTAK